MLRAILIVAIACACMVCRAAAQSEMEHDQPVVLRVQGLPVASEAHVTAIATRAVTREFLKKYPAYQLEPFAMPEMGASTLSMDSGPLMAIATALPPHVIKVNFRQSSTYSAQGFLEPLEILLARVLGSDPRLRQTDENEMWLADPSPQQIAGAVELIRQRVPNPAWPVVYRAADDADDGEHVWAVPTSNLVMALLYRKDLFARAGLDPNRAPKDWDELLDYARKLTIPQKQQYAVIFDGGILTSWAAHTFMVANGARAVQQDESGKWRAVYDSREAAEAVYLLWQLLRGAYQRDGQRIEGAALLGTRADGDLLWQRGQVAMRFWYLEEEMLRDINPQLIGIAQVPTSGRSVRGAEVNCRMLGVFGGSTPQQKLAAMRYIWFVTGPEAQRIRTAVFVENGYGRFVNPMLLEQFGYDYLLRHVPAGWKEAFDEAMESGVPEPYGKNTQNIYRFMSEPINRALEMPLEQLGRQQAIDQIQQLLRLSVRDFNRHAIGDVPPATMRMRRAVSVMAIILVAIMFSLGMIHVLRYFTKVAAPFVGTRSRRRFLSAYLLLFPAIALVLMWQYLPLIGGLSLAFLDYRLVLDSLWVGADNFASVLFDYKFWAALGRTFYFVALMIALGFWPPILLAMLLQEVPTKTAKYFFRTIYYLPALVSGVIVMFLWKQLYQPSEFGILNQLLLGLNKLDPITATLVKWALVGCWLSLIAALLRLAMKLQEASRWIRLSLALAALGLAAAGWFAVHDHLLSLVGRFHLEPLRWIHSPELAMLCVVIPLVWAASGPGSILYLAALKSVSEELYEAAEIDGATHWHKIVYVVLPRLKYLIVIQFIAAVIGAFKGGSDYILALTGGGPNDATMILPLEIFIRTFMDLQFGIGTAMAWILGALLIGFTAWQLKMLSRAEFRTT